MAQCEWAVICDYAFLDSRGKACLIGIFDAIFAKKVPAIHRQATLVIQVHGKPREKLKVRIEIARPNGTSLARIEANGELSESGGAGLQLELGPMNLPDYGSYACNIAINDEPDYHTRFDVREIPNAGVN